MERPKTLHLFSVMCGEWVRFLTTEYPFIKHIPIAIVMSISHISDCATICRKEDNGVSSIHFALRLSFGRERETASYKHRAAPGAAMTGNGGNETPVQPQSERDKRFSARSRRRQWGRSHENHVRVKFPWSWQPPAV